ncbi:MAG: hypothetical protein ACT4QE_24480 [Anaerolineales bacterium]
MYLRQRLGIFFVFASVICLLFFASDVAHDYVIDNFAPLWLGLTALIVGVPLWLSRSGQAEEEKPPARFRMVRSLFGGADKPKKK